jgi:hypothetical protein
MRDTRCEATVRTENDGVYWPRVVDTCSMAECDDGADTNMVRLQWDEEAAGALHNSTAGSRGQAKLGDPASSIFRLASDQAREVKSKWFYGRKGIASCANSK